MDNYLLLITLEQISDTQRYKVLGNAVTTSVVEAIIKRIIEVDERRL